MPPWMDEARPSLTVTAEKQGRWRVFRLRGELVFHNCDELAQALDVHVPADDATGQSVAVDASSLEYFDSAGLRCLVAASRRVRRQGGEFMVLDAGHLARRIHWMSLTEILPVMTALPA